ncbi:MAG: ABC transporter ATP-binding protein [Deltaproteobacteria bacterium]|nr:ABC transporter ATP-binding protein [Deltaproteobacteria bacterium]MBW2051522.1 ABC transporter ATP-binding protein [Deltaproteobacteria bacterium]MBW2139736.1 ABC transporter ATP-binding protein [Deltaproteobacteria bacterium]MBW2322512.1 ABC transporter ATP-binding protein [Deltaproteobacteria bacterium]
MLEVTNLKAYYGGIQALKGVNLSIKEGGIVTIIGANGAGKTTLLKSISGLIRSKEGRIVFQDQEITKFLPRQIVSLGIALAPEGRQVFASLSVEDNLNLGAYLYYRRKNRSKIRTLKEEVFELFPVLKERLSQLAGTLSGGEQQMLSIARAMMVRPKLLILDEPSMGLAPLFVLEIFKVLERLNQRGTTILLVEQNARAALRVAQYGYVLETGIVILEGQAHKLLVNEKIKKAYLGD